MKSSEMVRSEFGEASKWYTTGNVCGLLNDLLVHDGYTVSFDIDTLREGDFDETLLKRIDQCVDFILVVDKHKFDSYG